MGEYHTQKKTMLISIELGVYFPITSNYTNRDHSASTGTGKIETDTCHLHGSACDPQGAPSFNPVPSHIFHVITSSVLVCVNDVKLCRIT
ncbi:hypothetical protein EWB00_003885 [Schistosoma japonicum]|uniref:Uncharacterized protein n=1 Tax=Schistosoma japonicum TaxID=6182 RepID=A0A4Z2D6Z9_SCHJA|nr:hypothetical protein EWB00_003885 [Schistosoma japonicum]